MKKSIPVAVARERARRAASELARDPRVRLVYLFGSAADPDATHARDVDVAIWTDPELSLDQLLHLRADLVAAGGAGLDLVSLNDAGVVLAKEVANSGRCLFARDPGDEVAFVTRARTRYFDFKPFIEVQKHYAIERNAARLARAGRAKSHGPQA